MDISEILKKYRLEKGLSKREMARLLLIDICTYRRYERGKIHTFIRASNLYKIWLLLKISMPFEDFLAIYGDPLLKKLQGQQFGQLTVLSRNVNKYNEWICRCTCGRISVVPQHLLTTNRKKSCGCMPRFSGRRKGKCKYLLNGTNITKIKKKEAYKNSSSGIRGVYQRRNTNAWVAAIRLSGRLIHLGTFSNEQEAMAARERAEKKYFAPIIQKYEEQSKSEE